MDNHCFPECKKRESSSDPKESNSPSICKLCQFKRNLIYYKNSQNIIKQLLLSDTIINSSPVPINIKKEFVSPENTESEISICSPLILVNMKFNKKRKRGDTKTQLEITKILKKETSQTLHSETPFQNPPAKRGKHNTQISTTSSSKSSIKATS